MKFIHAIVYTPTELKNAKYYGLDETDWDDLNNGDYIVHALYCVDRDKIVMIDDNTHTDIERQIDAFLDGVRFVNMTLPTYSPVFVEYAFVVADRAYDAAEVREKLLTYDYAEID